MLVAVAMFESGNQAARRRRDVLEVVGVGGGRTAVVSASFQDCSRGASGDVEFAVHVVSAPFEFDFDAEFVSAAGRLALGFHLEVDGLRGVERD
jgi:hypothetical protein